MTDGDLVHELEQFRDDLRRLADDLEQFGTALREVLHAVNLREARIIAVDALGRYGTSDVLERVQAFAARVSS